MAVSNNYAGAGGIPTLDFSAQGGHVLADMKFPVFSLCFPCVAEIFPVFFY